MIISNSGRSRDLLDVAEIARRKGATMIVITASGSPLAQLAQGGANQILLAVDHPEDYDRYSPMVSRLLHLMVIDILTTARGPAPARRTAADAAGDQEEPARQALRPAGVAAPHRGSVFALQQSRRGNLS